MDITNVEIRHYRKNGFSSKEMNQIRHQKILPYLSIVQAVEGSYEISLGGGAHEQTGEGGFFIAPSDVQQNILHCANPNSKIMTCRWLFLDVRLNRLYPFDQLYQLPTVICDERKARLNELFDRLFASDSIWSDYAICYEILENLIEFASPLSHSMPIGIQTALLYLTQHPSDAITVAELARIAHMSESNFYASFKRQTGSSPIAYLNRYRISLAAEQLIHSDKSITEIAYSVGINDPLYFSKLFKKNHERSPKEYRAMYRVNR